MCIKDYVKNVLKKGEDQDNDPMMSIKYRQNCGFQIKPPNLFEFLCSTRSQCHT